MAVLGKNGRIGLRRLATFPSFHRLPEAVAFLIHLENVAAVREPVEQRSGHTLSLEDLAPIAEWQVAGDQQARSLISVAKDPEQKLDAATTE